MDIDVVNNFNYFISLINFTESETWMNYPWLSMICERKMKKKKYFHLVFFVCWLSEFKMAILCGMMTFERRRFIFLWTCPFIIFIFLTIELSEFDVTLETASIVYTIKPCSIVSIHISSRWIDNKNGILIYFICISGKFNLNYMKIVISIEKKSKIYCKKLFCFLFLFHTVVYVLLLLMQL